MLLIEMEVSNYSLDVFTDMMVHLRSMMEISDYIDYGMIPEIVRHTCGLAELSSAGSFGRISSP